MSQGVPDGVAAQCREVQTPELLALRINLRVMAVVSPAGEAEPMVVVPLEGLAARGKAIVGEEKKGTGAIAVDLGQGRRLPQGMPRR